MADINTGSMTATTLQKAATAVAVVFLAVGVLGFIPGITTNYDTLGSAGHDSAAKLLGVFQVSVLHNLVHLSFGIVGLALARSAEGARTLLVGGGAVYLVLWLLGVIGAGAWIPTNAADNWLHLAFGVGLMGLAYLAGERPAVRSR